MWKDERKNMKKNMLILICASAISIVGCQKNVANVQSSILSSGGTLSIPVSELSSRTSFYPVTVDGTKMEIIAGRASDGTIRTAFNTCQVCYDSGNGYYKLDGDNLVCQNCGNVFTIDDVGIESGGCNPWPILESDRSIADGYVQISYDFLDSEKSVFAKWDK